jgi:hypothetical protein
MAAKEIDKIEKLEAFISDSNEKIKRFSELILERYKEDDTFYLQRHEFNQLRDIIFKDSVYVVNSNEFTYKGKKMKTMSLNLIERHAEMVRLNKLFFFHQFVRNKGTGDIVVHGTYVE